MSPSKSMPLFQPIKLVDVELSRPLPAFADLHGYQALKALVRLHGIPLGYVQLPLPGGRCTAAALSKAILDQHSWPIIRHLVEDGLAAPHPHGLQIADLLGIAHPATPTPLPSLSVAVCTRDRPDDLALCLDALSQLEPSPLEILVIDNAPRTERTEQLVRTRYPA